MSLSYDEGVAIAVGLGTADMQARGVASRAASDARIAQYQAQEAVHDLGIMTHWRDEWRTAYFKKEVEQIRASRVASAGLIFMNAFMKAIDNMPKDQAEKLLSEVRAITKDSINYVDGKLQATAQEKGGQYFSIKKEFENQDAYKKLGFDF